MKEKRRDEHYPWKAAAAADKYADGTAQAPGVRQILTGQYKEDLEWKTKKCRRPWAQCCAVRS